MALDLIDRVEYNTESFIPKNIVIMLISSIYTIFFNLFLSDCRKKTIVNVIDLYFIFLEMKLELNDINNMVEKSTLKY